MIYKILLPILIIALMVVVWFAGAGKFFQNNVGKLVNNLPSDTPTAIVDNQATVTPTQTPTPEKSNVPAGWSTYTNSEYNFEISYPSNYKALTSKEDLYGWPDALVLIYGGGQAYDLAIEVWDSEAQYKQKYPSQTVKVYMVDGKYLTILDQTLEPDNSAIISTFKLTQ